MASMLRDGQRPPQIVAGIIEAYFHRVAHPLYVGIISGYIGWSLERTQQVLDEMTDKDVVRPMTLEEKRAKKYPEVANVYVLVAEPSLAKANR